MNVLYILSSLSSTLKRGLWVFLCIYEFQLFYMRYISMDCGSFTLFFCEVYLQVDCWSFALYIYFISDEFGLFIPCIYNTFLLNGLRVIYPIYSYMIMMHFVLDGLRVVHLYTQSILHKHIMSHLSCIMCVCMLGSLRN